jgi:sugar phosphate isomerase/epimerase
MAGIVALQLYTVRDETEKDFAQTIRNVAEIGYEGVEFAGYGKLSAPEVAALLTETGLKAVGTHVGLDRLTNDFNREVDYCLSSNCPYLIVPSPGMDRNHLQEGNNLQRFTQQLNEFGERAKSQGLTLGYHNHNFEFEIIIDGKPLYDHLVADTDPTLVKLELDTYWAAYAGVKVIPLIQQLGERIITLHIKDMTPERTFTEVGDGTLDINGYREAARAIGDVALIVENDQPAIPSLKSARRSFENLRKDKSLS